MGDPSPTQKTTNSRGGIIYFLIFIRIGGMLGGYAGEAIRELVLKPLLDTLWQDTQKAYEELAEKPAERIKAMSLQCLPIILVLFILAYCTFDAIIPLSILFLGIGVAVAAFMVYVLVQDVPRVFTFKK
jgi:hypothetical protein